MGRHTHTRDVKPKVSRKSMGDRESTHKLEMRRQGKVSEMSIDNGGEAHTICKTTR